MRDGGGRFVKGHKVLTEWKLAASKANKGKRYSPKTEFKEGTPPWNKGKPHLAIKGDKNPMKRPEVAKKCSEANKGKKVSEETKEILRQYALVQFKDGMPEATKKKIGERLKSSEAYYESLKHKSYPPNSGQYKKGSVSLNKGKHHTSESIKKIKKARAKQVLPFKDSSIEVKVQELLFVLGIEFVKHQYFYIEHAYACDIFIPSLHLVIECDGDYWHNYPEGLEVDSIRTTELEDMGYRVKRFWEREIKEMNSDMLLEELKCYI